MAVDKHPVGAIVEFFPVPNTKIPVRGEIGGHTDYMSLSYIVVVIGDDAKRFKHPFVVPHNDLKIVKVYYGYKIYTNEGEVLSSVTLSQFELLGMLHQIYQKFIDDNTRLEKIILGKVQGVNEESALINIGANNWLNSI